MIMDSNLFKILLSTDNHLGFMEKDPIRQDDSFVSFEEILVKSKQMEPDFILLGGDLFHENKPSLPTLIKCTELLRKYSLSNKPIQFKILSNQSVNFNHSEDFNFANFNDPNLNVGIPVFTIHGNHDDLIDQTALCALDAFHASGLVNLFGKNVNIENVEITPLLMQKGTTKLAIYGFGAIRNERAHRLFQQNKIVFLRPESDPDDWFSILVIHQNRVKHGATNYVPESFIPNFIDLVIWGHEHDCRIVPEWNTGQGFYVSQPGSSVATSLSDGESLEKFVGLLEVRGKDFNISKHKLETIRPLVIAEICLDDEDCFDSKAPKIEEKVEQFCHNKVEEMLSVAATLRTSHPQQPKLPLIRLKIDYSCGFEMFSIMRFSQKYVDKVANPKNMIVLHRQKDLAKREQAVAIKDGENIILSVKMEKHSIGLDAAGVDELVRQYFADSHTKLSILNTDTLTRRVNVCVSKDDKNILDKSVDEQRDWYLRNLKERHVNESEIVVEVSKLIELYKRTDSSKDDEDEDSNFLSSGGSNILLSKIESKFEPIIICDDEAVPKRGRSNRRASTNPSRGRGRRKATDIESYFTIADIKSELKPEIFSDSDNEDSIYSHINENDSHDDDVEICSVDLSRVGRGRGQKGRGRGSATTKSNVNPSGHSQTTNRKRKGIL